MMEHQRADARLWIHHHSFGQMHADFLGAQKHPYPSLVLKIWASRITEAISFAAVARSKPVRHANRRRIGETPILAYAPVQPFGASFRRLNRQCLQAVRVKIA